MSIEQQIETLESLSELDADLARLSTDLESSREVLVGKKTELAELESRLTRHRESLAEMDRTRSELVGELRQTTIQLDKSREKMARCRTEREANAVQRELEEIRKLVREREGEIQKIQTFGDMARSEIEQIEESKQSVLGDLSESEGAAVDRIRQLEASIGESQARRDNLLEKLPKVLARRYEVIRKRQGSAVAHSTDGTCSACFIALPPMQFQTLRRGDSLDQCPQCKRIIYFKVPTPAAEAEAEAEAPDDTSAEAEKG